jgi:thiamine pyrophosphate-dependent acetolactate synthase large subunit-like protein
MMFSSSGMLATMAYRLPYSVGAAIAYPGRQVVCLAGDGGFTNLFVSAAVGAFAIAVRGWCKPVTSPIFTWLSRRSFKGEAA